MPNRSPPPETPSTVPMNPMVRRQLQAAEGHVPRSTPSEPTVARSQGLGRTDAITKVVVQDRQEQGLHILFVTREGRRRRVALARRDLAGARRLLKSIEALVRPLDAGPPVGPHAVDLLAILLHGQETSERTEEVGDLDWDEADVSTELLGAVRQPLADVVGEEQTTWLAFRIDEQGQLHRSAWGDMDEMPVDAVDLVQELSEVAPSRSMDWAPRPPVPVVGGPPESTTYVRRRRRRPSRLGPTEVLVLFGLGASVMLGLVLLGLVFVFAAVEDRRSQQGLPSLLSSEWFSTSHVAPLSPTPPVA